CESPGLFRCDQCTGQAHWCEACCLAVHQISPFHHPKKWNGRYFKKVDLDKLGLTIFFGHGGDPCPMLSTYTATHTSQTPEDEDISMGELESNEWEDQVRTGFIGDRMRFVDSTGIFSRCVRWCCCPQNDGGMLSQDLQLLSARIYPATPGKPSTGFTFTVLEGFWLDALECKTAAMNFLSKLRRLTNHVFPLSVPNVYPAFMRCSRQYRNLKNLLRAGLAHDQNRARAPGDLGLFCVTCPQIGINCSFPWVISSTEIPTSKLYRPQVVTDGNFKLDNLKMRNPNDDVRLSDGEMFCVGSVSYEEHLRITPDRKQRSNCNNHHAVNETNAKRKDVDSTGIGACACARHGCFYPYSIVGFKVGESTQANMDYAISEVFRQLPSQIKEFLLIYDISCQWVPISWNASGNSHSISWRALARSRGKFRRHCGRPLTKLSEAPGVCLLAVNALIAKLDRANEGFDSTEEAFQDLSRRVGTELTLKWEQEETEALQRGGLGRKIYKAENAKGGWSTGDNQTLIPLGRTWVALITDGLNIERLQNNLKKHIKSLGRRPTAAQKRDLIGKKDSLQKRQAKFEKSMLSFIRKHQPADEGTSDDNGPDRDYDNKLIGVDLSDSDEEEEDWEEDSSDEGDPQGAVEVEEVRLSLPSNLKDVPLAQGLRTTLYKQEGTLREGQINDSLRKLRLALGAKSWMLRNNVRGASGGRARTRAWDGVKTRDLEIRRCVQIYTQATSALRRMRMGAQWQPITKQDLAMSGDLTEANRVGQRSSTLAWFWRLEDGAAIGEIDESGEMGEFYRVNWLRAKARVARWAEEKNIVAHEMQWT
ncbi:hypothetical protein B0H14DRAFT_3629631, partial [Mycena olivaceomarginata]